MKEALVMFTGLILAIVLFWVFLTLGTFMFLTGSQYLYSIVMSLYASILTASFLGFSIRGKG